jgi:hypothetical protein
MVYDKDKYELITAFSVAQKVVVGTVYEVFVSQSKQDLLDEIASLSLSLNRLSLEEKKLLFHDQALLYDDFSSDSINTLLWQPVKPFYDSSITESDGVATFVNRGQLLSVDSFYGPIDIRGRISLTGSTYDIFRIVTRADGISNNPWHELSGIQFSFSMHNGDWGEGLGNISIDLLNYPHSSQLSYGNFPIAPNVYYDFRLTDDGSNVALFLSDLDTPLITASDSSIIGNSLGLYNREGVGGGVG